MFTSLPLLRLIFVGALRLSLTAGAFYPSPSSAGCSGTTDCSAQQFAHQSCCCGINCQCVSCPQSAPENPPSNQGSSSNPTDRRNFVEKDSLSYSSPPVAIGHSVLANSPLLEFTQGRLVKTLNLLHTRLQV
jgi:hypothetical protein